MRSETLAAGAASLHVEIHGDPQRQPAVLLIPSLGRGIRDFDHLGRALFAAGFSVLAPQPRGIGASRGPLEDIRLHDLAGDAAAVLRACCSAPADVIGHAFGNRVARCLASDHPGLVRRLCLLGAGGLLDPDPVALAAFRRFINEDLDPAALREAMHTANFSPGSDPGPWLSGWWFETARRQAAAAQATAREAWWLAGDAPLLIVQGADDRMALPGNGRSLAVALGERATLKEVPRAAHALLPEQPEIVAAEVLAFLR